MYLEYFLVFASFFIYDTTGSALHGRCLSNEDCGTIDTYCKNEICVCKENFAVWYDSCVHHLNDICEHNHQCYCGADCEDKIACIGRNCTCKPGHKPYRSRRCIYDPDNPPTPSISRNIYCPTSITSITIVILLKIL